MSLLTLLSLIVKIAFMIALGYFLRRRNIITEEIQTGLADILVLAVLPLSILSSSSHDFSREILRSILFIGVAAILYYSVGLVLMRGVSRFLPLPESERKVFSTMTVFANTGFVGFPVMTELFGKPGLLLAVIYNMAYNLFMYTFGISLLSGSKGMDWRKVLANPVTVASVASLLIYISPFRIPSILMQPITDVGSMSVPLSMIIMGASIARVPLIEILRDKYSYLVSFLRLLVLPLIMLFAMVLIHPDKTTGTVAVLMTALPCGSMNVIFAEKYNCAPQFASKSVIQSMVFMAGTLPLLIYLCGILL